MSARFRRVEQVEQNRERVLTAAREVFMEQGFHAATLDQIAERAGFTKGVVYSQFTSKADLFLTLLEERIAARAAENARLAGRATSAADVDRLIDRWQRTQRAEPAWSLLVIEFRVHAARHPALNERYARVHERTLGSLTAALADVHERLGIEPAEPLRELALAVLALGNGITLEDAVRTHRTVPAVERRAAARLIGLPSPEGTRQQ